MAYGLDRIDPAKDLRITLIEAADRILPALPQRISEATARLLTDLGVDVRPDAKVSQVRRDGVELAGGDFIPSELVVWAAGVKGPDVLGDLDGLEVSRTNQLIVTPTLQTTRDPNIFAIGDCAYLLPEGQAWAKLPASYQTMLRAACTYALVEMLAGYDARNAKALNRVVAAGAQLVVLTPDILRVLRTALEQVLDEEAAKSEQFKRVLESSRAFRFEQHRWFSIADARTEMSVYALTATSQ